MDESPDIAQPLALDFLRMAILPTGVGSALALAAVLEGEVVPGRRLAVASAAVVNLVGTALGVRYGLAPALSALSAAAAALGLPAG